METVDQHRDRNVLTLTLDRPDSLNAFDLRLREELHEALETAATDDDVCCVVLTGTGGAFSAGGDVDRMRERLSTGVEATEFEANLDGTTNELLRTLHRLPVPTVAGVDGVALGMGLSVALACDLVVASEDARFGAAFRNVGLGPDTGLSYLLPRLAGTKVALELLYTGEPIDAVTAEAHRLVNRVVPAADLDGAVEELARHVAEGPTRALVGAKDLVLGNLERDFDEPLDAEAARQALLYTIDDHREGVRAFEEDCAPEFEGERPRAGTDESERGTGPVGRATLRPERLDGLDGRPVSVRDGGGPGGRVPEGGKPERLPNGAATDGHDHVLGGRAEPDPRLRLGDVEVGRPGGPLALLGEVHSAVVEQPLGDPGLVVDEPLDVPLDLPVVDHDLGVFGAQVYGGSPRSFRYIGFVPRVAIVSAQVVRRFEALRETWSLILCGPSAPNTVTVEVSASYPRSTWNGSQGLASASSAKQRPNFCGPPWVASSDWPGTAPPTSTQTIVIARPMVAFARNPGRARSGRR